MQQSVNQVLPRARNRELIIREMPDEVLVYDMDRQKAHCLNHTSAFIWKHCDGKRTVKEMALLFERERLVLRVRHLRLLEFLLWFALR